MGQDARWFIGQLVELFIRNRAMKEHLEAARVWLERATDATHDPGMGGSEPASQSCALISIATSLTGILELLTGVIGDRGSVVDVRVQGSVSTGDQR